MNISKNVEDVLTPKRENVILLSLSVIRFAEMNNYFVRKDGPGSEVYFNGFSQLEPGTKYFLWKLAQEGRKVSRIVFISSNEVTIPPKS